MPSHYVYQDAVDKNSLCQGDVLKRTPELMKLLRDYHPHYGNHTDYRYFVVLTQSCDLVRRRSGDCKSRYISIGAARSLDDALAREVSKHQDEWQVDKKIIGSKAQNAILMFLTKLIDNNEPGCFYLHKDPVLGIDESCCVFLALSVTLRSQHYDDILAAKIAQLTDTFQAKFGWLLGNMYSRVGTIEWDTVNPGNPVRKEAQRILDETLISLDDEQIKQGLSAIGGKAAAASKSREELIELMSKKVVPRSKRFLDRAVQNIHTNKSIKTVSQIGTKVGQALESSTELRSALAEVLVKNKDSDAEAVASEIVAVLRNHCREIISDASLPDRNDILERFIKMIVQDPVIAALFK